MKAHWHLHVLATAGLLFAAGCQQNGAAVTEPHGGTQAGSAALASDVQKHALRELDEGPPKHVSYRPGEIPWKQGPSSFEQGAQFAVLEGDPAAPGVFTMQIKLPGGFIINPHWHPNVERVTVLRGTFHLGAGDTVDKSGAEALPTGSYTTMPKRMVHYAIAGGETVIQLTTVGPSGDQLCRPQGRSPQAGLSPAA